MAVDATVKASIKAGIEDLVDNIFTASVTFNGNAYNAAHGVLQEEKVYSAMGALDGYTDTYTLMQADLDGNGDTPAAGGILTTPDGDKRILRIRRDSLSVCQRLDVGDEF